jgi:hypothetical protein
MTITITVEELKAIVQDAVAEAMKWRNENEFEYMHATDAQWFERTVWHRTWAHATGSDTSAPVSPV